MVAVVLTKAPSFRVANSSSAMATGPVSAASRHIAREIQVSGRLHGVGRGLAGHQRGVVEHRLIS